MKKNATPELEAGWWSDNLPEGLPSAKELEKALDEYAAAYAKLEKAGPENNLAACLKALTQCDAAAKKLQGEAEKLARSPPRKSKSTPEDYENAADVLKKFPKLTEAARKEADELASKAGDSDDEEDEDGEGLLGNEKDYRAYLKLAVGKLRKRPMNFALGLGKNPEDHRFLFHKTKSGRSLITTIKSETDLKKLTWGIAGRHEQKPTVLTLALEGPQLGGMKKKVELLLKYFGPLPFNRVLLMVEGEEAEDIEDKEEAESQEAGAGESRSSKESGKGDDPGAAFKARLAALLPAIKKSVAANEAGGAEAKLRASEAGVYARKLDFDAANRLLDEVERALKSAAGSSQPSGRPPNGQLEAALENWKSARSSAIATLKELAKEIAAAKHAESKNALIELNAVIKNLSVEPDTPQKVAELERWLDQDDVVYDVCAMAEDIRTPLLEALTGIKAQLAA